jgi:DNA-binding MarR family transcriptional regulator
VTPEVAGLIDSLVTVIRVSRAKEAYGADQLTKSQITVLSMLARRSPRRMTSLAEQLRVDLSVLSRQVATLDGLGLVTRTKDPEDRRACLLDLTDNGRAALREIWTRRVASLTQSLAQFDSDQLKGATAVVNAISTAWTSAIQADR